MAECPECGGLLEREDSTCSACGASASDRTASFEPVGGVYGADSPAEEVDEGPALVVRKGPQPGERFYLDRARLSVGRDPQSDIFLNDMTVSRTHAVLEVIGASVTVRDAGSLNGTYVNGVCVDVAPLRDGDVVQVGTFQMVFIGGEGSDR